MMTTNTNYKSGMSQFKADIKQNVQLVRTIRTMRNEQRKSPIDRDAFIEKMNKYLGEFGLRYTWSLDSDLKFKLRHMHLAYSLLRGRAMYRIEAKVSENNEPNYDEVLRYAKKYVGDDLDMGLFDKLFGQKKPEPKPPALKMYVLVRTDMHPINRAVQAGHAVAEYLRCTDNQYSTPWDNGYMIYLGVENGEELNKWEARIQAANIKFSTFVEPDWKILPDPVKTATACCTTGELFADLPLLNLDAPTGPTVDYVITDKSEIVL
jgi:hypothetical protein